MKRKKAKGPMLKKGAKSSFAMPMPVSPKGAKAGGKSYRKRVDKADL